MANHVFVFGFLTLLPSGNQTGDNHTLLRSLAGKAETVVVGVISSEVSGVVDADGVVTYNWDFTVSEVLKGKAEAKQLIRVSATRFELSREDALPYLKKDAKCILFLRPVEQQATPLYQTIDGWFSIQSYSPALVRTLKTIIDGQAK